MTEQALTTVAPRRDLAVVTDFTPAQIDLIKRTIAVGCTDDELELFVQVCRTKRLDPFSRQIYAIKRWDSKQKREVMAIQIGIDGYRIESERTGLYIGMDPIEWCDAKGNWTEVWMGDGPPFAARARVWRKGFDRPVPAVARFSSYCAYGKDGKPMANWRTMPEVMIAKCAEALARRIAFPKELGGTTIPEELDHDHENIVHYDAEMLENGQPAPNTPPAPTVVGKAEMGRLWKAVTDEANLQGVDIRKANAAVRERLKALGAASPSKVTPDIYQSTLEVIPDIVAELKEAPQDNGNVPSQEQLDEDGMPF